MALKKGMAIGIVLVLLIALMFGWYIIAANYGYSALAGKYVYDMNGHKCTLILKADRSFTEELNHDGSSQKVIGTWYRYGEAHVSFSSTFITLPGQELNAEGEVHGQFEKRLGLFPRLTLAPLPGGPTFKRMPI